MEKQSRKWRVDVYINGNINTFIDIFAEDAKQAEKLAEKKFKSPITFKAKKAY